MPTLRSYIRHLVRDSPASADLGGLLLLPGEIHRALAPMGVQPGPLYEDAADTAGRPLLSRPAGHRLNSEVAAGDIVLFPSFDRSFCSIDDMARTVAAWDRIGARVWVYDLELDTGTTDGQEKLDLLVRLREFQVALNQERTRLASAREKAAGKKIRGRPPWGTRVQPGTWQRKLVVVPHLLEVGRQVVKWHEELELSFDDIAERLRRMKMKGAQKGGMPWSPDQVLHAYHGTVKLLGLIDQGVVSIPRRKGV